MKFIVNIVLSSIYVNMDVNLFVCLALLLYGQKFVLIAICMVEWIDGCVDGRKHVCVGCWISRKLDVWFNMLFVVWIARKTFSRKNLILGLKI